MRELDPGQSSTPKRSLVTRRRILTLSGGALGAVGTGALGVSLRTKYQTGPTDGLQLSSARPSAQASPSGRRGPKPPGYSTREVYDWADATYRHIQASRSAPAEPDGGPLAWGESRALHSYLAMYEATSDTVYLDRLVHFSQPVLAVRDDRVGRADYLGRSQGTWSASAPYTVSSLDLRDTADVPLARLVVAAPSKSVLVDLQPRAGNLFDLAVSTSSGLTERHRGLSLSSRHPRYLVQTLQDQFPGPSSMTATDLRTDTSRSARLAMLTSKAMESNRYVFAVHTGMICSPFAHFASLVANQPELRRRYAAPAKALLEAAEVAVALHDDDWILTSGEAGAYKFAAVSPVLIDGIYLPHNEYLAMARCIAHLFRATQNPTYRDRATQMYNLFLSDVSRDEAPSWPYHWTGSPIYRGISLGDGPSVHCPRMSPIRSIEDTSHGSIDVDAVVAGVEAALPVPMTLIRRMAETFRTRVVRVNANGQWATATRIGPAESWSVESLAGTRWLPLAKWDRRVYTIVSALLNQIEPIPKEGQMLSTVADMVRLR